SQKIACAPYAKRPAGRQYVHCIPSPSTHPNAITACFERRVAKCYRVKLGEALPWCCVLLLRRIAVRAGRRAWRSSSSFTTASETIDNTDDRAAGLCLCHDNLYGVAGSAINRSHLADIPYVVYHVYRIGFREEYQECMARGYFEDVVFRLPSQAIIVSIAPYEARTASLCEGYAEIYPWNRTHHGFIEIFNGLYETSVPESCTGALVFSDCYAIKF